jgi:hypothetical protein
MATPKRLQFIDALRAFDDAAGEEVETGLSQYEMGLAVP